MMRLDKGITRVLCQIRVPLSLYKDLALKRSIPSPVPLDWLRCAYAYLQGISGCRFSKQLILFLSYCKSFPISLSGCNPPAPCSLIPIDPSQRAYLRDIRPKPNSQSPNPANPENPQTPSPIPQTLSYNITHQSR